MRVLSLNFGDSSCASSQFRIHAYLESLAALGIQVDTTPANGFTDWKKIEGYDAVIVQKKLFRAGHLRQVRNRARRLIYDIDDAIWESHGKPHGWLTRLRTRARLRRTAQAADLCLAANQVICSYLSQWTDRARIFPMALDEQLWRPTPPPSPGPLRIGWSGAPGNLPYLVALEPALAPLQKRYPEIEWTVLCGRAPAAGVIPWRHIPWEPGCEPRVVPSFSIGLLPLPDNPFAAGKSPIKGLQYMACAVPTVATPLAATRELFANDQAALFVTNHSEWTQALERLIIDEALRRRLGGQARTLFESRYALRTQAAVLANFLKGS